MDLSTRLPFAQAATVLGRLLQITVTKETARRTTERAGAAYVAAQTDAVAFLEAAAPLAPPGPAVQQLSVDGAMVPLTGGVWAEVKTLAIGTVHLGCGDRPPHTTDLSYFSRMAEHETFNRLATVETHRRGTERAGQVVAVVDGADWIQGFVDLHCPHALRILDWPHAAGYLAQAAHALFGPGTAATSAWLEQQLHELRQGDPDRVLAELGQRHAAAVTAGQAEVSAILHTSLAYLRKRRDQINYALWRAAGYPIGSGAVESANKVVVEARLKGAGMHWHRRHVNPMVALRTALCSDRWDAAWADLQAWRRAARRSAQTARRIRPHPVVPTPVAPPPAPDPSPPPRTAAAPRRTSPPTIVQGRPTMAHPWKRHRFLPRPQPSAKT